MAGARVLVDDTAIRAKLSAAAAAGVALQPLLEDIGASQVVATQRRFEAEAGPGGTKWSPFAKSTLRRMNPKRKPPQLLRDTNRLYQSIVYQASGASVLIGTNLAYAGLHQFGGEVKQAARSQTSTFRLAREGAGRKVDKDGNVVRVGSKLRFAKASTRVKSRHQKTFDVGARSFKVPARPYLGIDATDQAEILAIVDDHMARALGGGARP